MAKIKKLSKKQLKIAKLTAPFNKLNKGDFIKLKKLKFKK
tara:strand:+ start:219 stop:338 length:120 start_codon:yes stop_codon:yes gene_type:complete